MSGCDGWQAGGWTIAHWRDGFQAHVACTLHGPLIILFEQQSTDEADDGSFVREDSDHVAASLDFAVEAFERIGAVDLGAVLDREVHIGQHVGLGVVHQRCQLGDTWSQLIGHLAPLLAGRLCIVLGKCGADPGGDDATLGLAGVCHGVAHEVHAASLPGRAKHFGDRCLQSFMRIRDDQLDGAQAAPGQAAQKFGPERLRLAVADGHAQHFSPAIGVDRDSDDHRH